VIVDLIAAAVGAQVLAQKLSVSGDSRRRREWPTRSGGAMGRIAAFYASSGAEMFDRARVLRRFCYKFEDEKLAGLLKKSVRVRKDALR
jgi:hypothetical protein